MATVEEIQKVIGELNVDRKATFAEFIYAALHDKFIEVYLGDSYEEVSTEQISSAYPAVFCGKVVGAYKEVLVINCAFIDKRTKKMTLGHILFINERAIRGLTPVDGNGIMEDAFLRSREALLVKENFAK